MAAMQATEIYENSRVHILNSKSIGACYAILSSVDFSDKDPESVIDMANSVVGRIKTAQVCPAIRNTEMNGMAIHDGDTIAIMDKQIIACEKERVLAAKETVKQLLGDGEHFALTVFVGKDAKDADEEAISDYISREFPDCDAYFIRGGQEIYSYIFVAE